MKSYIINEIKAFHDLIQIKSLSTGQIALWYALMYVNNKCAWTEWFTVANQMLESHSGLSRSGIAKARNVLRQHGIIDFKQQGSKATLYHLYDLADGYRTQESIPSDSGVLNSAQVGVTLVRKVESEKSHIGAQNRAPLNRLDKTRQDKTDNSCCCQISRALENELAVPLSSTIVDMVSTWREEWPSEEIPLYAIEQAVLLNKRNVKYIDAMLSAWRKKGLNTLAAIKAEQADFAARKKQPRGKIAPRNAHFAESETRDLSKLIREE